MTRGHSRHEELNEDDDVSDARREISDKCIDTFLYLTDNILVRVDLVISKNPPPVIGSS